MSELEFLPFARPSIGDGEINAVVECMRSGWLTTGKKTLEFETKFAERVGAKYAVAVNSATAGLHLALEALGVTCGDQVVTTPYTFTASAEIIRYFGADPVFVDIDKASLNIDVAKLAATLETHPKIKAILPVHFAGQSCDMDAIVALSKQYNVPIVEDAAHAFPTTYKNRVIGSISDVTVFSFYVTKTLATGEGGMIVTDDENLAKRMKVMRLHGISKDAFDRYTKKGASWYYEIVAPGFKYNMTDIAAAIGIEQLARGDGLANRRREIAELYFAALADLPIDLPTVLRPGDQHSWHLFVLGVYAERAGVNREDFIERMTAHGIGTSVHFIPLHIQPYWREQYKLQPDDFPVALERYTGAVSLPIYPDMSDADVERVIAAVQASLSG